MVTERVTLVESKALALQAIRAVKAEMQASGRCNGQCRTCLPELLRECMSHRPDLRHDAEPAQTVGLSV